MDMELHSCESSIKIHSTVLACVCTDRQNREAEIAILYNSMMIRAQLV